jgi:peptide/nickel transport system permease protein
MVGLGFVVLVCCTAIGAQWLAPYSSTAVNPANLGQAPSWAHPFGLDYLGRDILSRTIYGSRVALVIGVVATMISVAVGTTIGAMSGYFGGTVDSILSRVVDTLMAFPILVLLLTLSAVFGPSLANVTIILGTTLWATYARVVRADVLSLKHRDFVTAAQAIGASNPRIIFRHLIPNVLAPVIVIATLGVGTIIIIAAALSFLGMGVPQPTASWGGDLSNARVAMQFYPHTAIVPGLAIALTVLAFNLLGDGLRDALDPRQVE